VGGGLDYTPEHCVKLSVDGRLFNCFMLKEFVRITVVEDRNCLFFDYMLEVLVTYKTCISYLQRCIGIINYMQKFTSKE
jgi:hypothetical protein